MRHRFLTLAASAAAAAFFWSIAPARAADDAAALLAKHRAFVGWQLGDGTFKTLRLGGKDTNAKGETVYTFSEVRAGLIYRTTYTDAKRGGITTDDGFTGHILWQSNGNGFTTPTFGDPAKFTFAYDAILNEATTQLAGTLQGSATVDGKATQIVRVTLPGGYAIDLYVDPATGAYVQAIIDPDGPRVSTLHILSYIQAAPGKRIIGSYRFGTSSSTWSYDKVESNLVLSDEAFHPPAPQAVWAFTNPQPFPFTVTDKRFIVDAKIDGVAGKFVLDTGADGIYLSKPFAARVHAKPFSSGEASGIAGSAKMEVDRIDTLEIGGNTLSNVITYAVGDDMDDNAPDGVIGFDLFAGAIVKLDSTTQRMTLEDPTSSVDQSAGVALKVDLTTGVPSVPMKMDGTIDVDAELDSGSYYYVLFGDDLISKHGLKMLVDPSLVGYLEAHPTVGGVGGYEIDRCGHVDSLVLGPIVYQGAPACVSSSFSGRDVLVGFDFLRHFDYIFNYPHGQLIMIPHKQ